MFAASECRSCEECELFPFQDIEVVIDWFSVVMWGSFKINISPIDGASDFSCPLRSVDREVCCAGTFSINSCVSV